MFTFVADMPDDMPDEMPDDMPVESVDVFFVVGIGGLAVSFLFCFVTASTMCFTANVHENKPLFVFMYTYLVAELFSISSIMVGVC